LNSATKTAHATAARRHGRIWPFILVLILAGAAAGGVWWQREQDWRWRWEPIPMPERVARVPEIWEVDFLAERLQKTKKVRDAATFLEAARQVGLERVEVGGYMLPDKAGPRDLAQIFKAAPALQKVTFPEGFTAAQMAQRLAKNEFTAAKEFQHLVYPPGRAVSPWEGRLFPDTYLLPHKGTAQELVQRLYDRYKEIVAKLPKALPRGAKDKPLTLDEVTTLASLVERETSVPAERPLVAGVLMNRLVRKMPLQCDASVQYALQRAAAAKGIHEHQIVLRRDYKFPSPYNTYLYRGLPPGPICNPGEASLRAAAAPQATPYFFYVMSPKLRRHRFAKTFAEHQHNIALARRERGD